MRTWRITGKGRHGQFTRTVKAIDYNEAKRIVCRGKAIIHIESIVLIENA